MVAPILDVVTTAAILFIVTLGLLIVFGMMKIINFSHGAFLAIGGYSVVVTTAQGWNPWLSLLLAPVAGALVGMVVERVVVRPLYGRPLDTILGTWGLSIVIIQLLTLQFGRGVQRVMSPSLGSTSVFGQEYSNYRLLLVVFAVVLGLAMLAVLQRTRLGLVGRAVIMDDELAAVLGVNTDLVRFVSFSAGAALASLAGALITPLASVDPNMGVPWLINAFMLSLLVGVSVPGLAAATIVLGGSQVAVGYLVNAVVAGLTIVTLSVLLLRLRPSGFTRG
jgi:branched-subunit amino acid ABC-type transport system permease component